MKILLTGILMMGLIFSQSGLSLTGGITYSTNRGDDVDEDQVEYKMGYRFGSESINLSCVIKLYANKGAAAKIKKIKTIAAIPIFVLIFLFLIKIKISTPKSMGKAWYRIMKEAPKKIPTRA